MHTAKHAATPSAKLAVAALLTLALAGAGCSSDDDTNAANNTSNTGGDAPAQTGSAENQIRAVHAQLSESLSKKDNEQACSLLTAAMRKQLAPNGDCPGTFDDFHTKAQADAEQPKLSKIKIDGDKATAQAKTSVSFNPTRVEFIKQDDQWLISGPLIENRR